MGLGKELDQIVKKSTRLKYSKKDLDPKDGDIWKSNPRSVQSQQEAAKKNYQIVDSDARMKAAEADVAGKVAAQKKEISKQLQLTRSNLLAEAVSPTNALMEQLDLFAQGLETPGVVSPEAPGYADLMSSALMGMPVDGTVDMLKYLSDRPLGLGV